MTREVSISAQKLFKMLEILPMINATTDLDQLLQVIMKAIKEVMESEASSLMLLDATTNELYFSKVEGGSNKVKEIRIQATQGVAGHVCQTGKPLIVNNVAESEFFLKTVDEKTKFQTRNILCVPLISQKKPIGVLEALNKKDAQEFTESDLKLFTAFADQVSIAIENARLYNMAVYDGLTKVHMRRFFEGWIEEEFARVRHYQTNFSLLMFDIDHFKRVNDTYGHQAGDHILREVARIAKENLRNTDILARYGGEEFIIGFPETELGGAVLGADRIRKAIETHEFNFEGKKIPITISIGVTNYQMHPTEKIDAFIKQADQALYVSKESGRNQVTVYEVIMTN